MMRRLFHTAVERFGSALAGMVFVLMLLGIWTMLTSFDEVMGFLLFKQGISTTAGGALLVAIGWLAGCMIGSAWGQGGAPVPGFSREQVGTSVAAVALIFSTRIDWGSDALGEEFLDNLLDALGVMGVFLAVVILPWQACRQMSARKARDRAPEKSEDE